MLPRVVVALAVATGLVLTGCQGDPQPESAPSSVEAFPTPPNMTGSLTVRLRPSLTLVSDDRCRPDLAAGLFCSDDGATGYRVIETSRPVVIEEVSTAPAEDRTSWETTVRFAADSRGDVRRAQEEAAGLGGLVAVTIGDNVVATIAPADLTPARATRLGLEKSEAWSVVDAFLDAQTRSKQGM